VATDFLEILFPVDISRGARGPGFVTSINVSTSGAEQRAQLWSQPRRKWDVSHALRNDTMAQELLAFFLNVAGRAIGFRFRDPLDNRIPDTAPVPLRQLSATQFQIQKQYTFGAYTFSRDIQKPVLGTVRVWNGVTPVAGSAYTLDTTTGLITFLAPPSFAPAASCQFDIPARFDVDEFSMTYDDTDVRTWDQIPIVELPL
jgi:uncharacterized protein (TIGR02217 family)